MFFVFQMFIYSRQNCKRLLPAKSIIGAGICWLSDGGEHVILHKWVSSSLSSLVEQDSGKSESETSIFDLVVLCTPSEKSKFVQNGKWNEKYELTNGFLNATN